LGLKPFGCGRCGRPFRRKHRVVQHFHHHCPLLGWYDWPY
jgi:hypothetical protein